MASTPTKPTTSAAHGRPAEELERSRKLTMEHLQQASAEIDKAHQEATGGVRRSLDSALDRLREVRGELRERAEDQTAEWQDALEQAPRRRSAVRWAAAPSARNGHPRRWRSFSAEIRKSKADLEPPPKGGAKG